ncbi:helix-turn-helix domain-containing protein [Rhodococcus sp. PSBB049]|uniref:helix-turn-helix domain-containing protein n=1 Tax=Rhodococcus sp. PSBB049 TaxID=2812863 RepID=UPI00197D0DF3|nr:helix-turn-helix domain-containing protein [Rhodococcus sp. PSBB049]QSE72197.1 helix-turn-helix domain-containing protein [Rhodococcus sp. PSBB049]
MSIFPPDSEWLTVTDGARYSGVSRSTFYKWIDAGHIPIYTAPSGVRRIKRSDLDNLFAKDGNNA